MEKFSDKYEILEEIGRGGMGILYKTVQRPLNRVVAIKVLYPHFLAEPKFLSRFQREARTMARLDHDHIIRVYDVEEVEGNCGIVMEYFDGCDLRRRLGEKGPLPFPEVVSLSLQMAEALAYAHRKGVVHRDIKPGNILVDRNGKVKIGDFGIAAAADELTLTTSGQVLGTPEFMAPEQARGDPVDGRADLYSLGMVMFVMLTGRSPYQGVSRAAVLTRLVSEDPHPLTYPASTPDRLKVLIGRLTRKEPHERYRRAEEVIRELRAIHGKTRAPVVEEATTKDARRKKPRRAWRSIAVVAGSLAVVIGALFFVRDTMGPPEKREVAEDSRTGELRLKVQRAGETLAQVRQEALSAGAAERAADLFRLAAEEDREADRLRQEAEGAASRQSSSGGDTHATDLFLQAEARSQDAAEIYRHATASSLLRERKGAVDAAYEKMLTAKEEAGGLHAPQRAAGLYAKASATEDRGKQASQEQRYEQALSFYQQAEGLYRQASSQAKRIEKAAEAREKKAQDKRQKKAEATTVDVVKKVPPPQADVNEAVRLFERFQDAYEKKNLMELKRIAEITPSQERTLIQLFRDYETLRTSLDEISQESSSVTALLTIVRLTDRSGNTVTPGTQWRTTRLVLDQQEGRWGLIRW